MNGTPQVSVVMCTYNDAEQLGASIDSVLNQEFSDFELIVVNDGSPDPQTGKILADYVCQDKRLRVITKQNEGLTKALMDGCGVARGEYIARIDTGDRYLAGRIGQQVEFMSRNPDVVINSCGTRYLTESREFMFERRVCETPLDATRLLRADSPGMIQGVTHHGSTMFRRDAYGRVGGYRSPFYFAQDLDLWMRLTDHGLLSFLPEILYEATFTAWGISGGYAREQNKLSELIIQLRRCRAAGQSEEDLLGRAAGVRPRANGEPAWRRRVRVARGLYFVAQILRQNGNPRCENYYREALGFNPVHWRALIGLLVYRVSKES